MDGTADAGSPHTTSPRSTRRTIVESTERAAGRVHVRRQIAVEELHHLRDRVDPVAQARLDLARAPEPMLDERLDIRFRVVDRRAVGGPVRSVVGVEQPLQARDVGAHVSVRRRHDGGGPAHHVIAAEQGAVLAQPVAHVVGGMAGSVDAFEAEPVALDDVPVAHLDVGRELEVRSLLDDHGPPVRRRRTPRAVRSEPVRRGRREAAQQGATGGVIPVGVGDEHVGDGFASQPVDERLDVRVEGRPGVDDRDSPAPDHVGAGAVKGERARVACDHAPDRRRHGLEHSVLELQLPVEPDVRRHRIVPRSGESSRAMISIRRDPCTEPPGRPSAPGLRIGQDRARSTVRETSARRRPRVVAGAHLPAGQELVRRHGAGEFCGAMMRKPEATHRRWNDEQSTGVQDTR